MDGHINFIISNIKLKIRVYINYINFAKIVKLFDIY